MLYIAFQNDVQQTKDRSLIFSGSVNKRQAVLQLIPETICTSTPDKSSCQCGIGLI